MLIVLGGLPGVGKTAIARELARAAGALHLRIDSIEQAIRQSALRVEVVEDAGYRAAYVVAEDNLKLGLTVIADSVNPLRATRAAWAAVATRAHVPIVEVEIMCSDTDEHRRRVEARTSDIPGHALPTWQDIVEREYHSWDREHLVIDSSHQSISQSVKTIRSTMTFVAASRGPWRPYGLP